MSTVTKTEDGKQFTADDYAWVPDPTKPSTWKLRINDAGHVRDAMARWNQTEEIPNDKKAGVLRKIIARAHEFAIDTTNFEKEHKLSSPVVAFIKFGPELVAAALAAPRDGLVRVPIIKIGKYVQGTRKIDISPALVKEIVQNFTARPVEVPLSYEHTIEHPQLAQGQPIPAAGWLKELEATPDQNGVLWGWAQLTDETKRLVESQQYKYISPAFAVHYPNHETGKDQGGTLLSVALTNRPFLDMPPIEMSVVLPAGDETDFNPPAGKPNKEKPVAKMKKVKVSPITEGDQKGHVLVEHADFPKTEEGEDKSYFADAGELRKALADAPEPPAADGKDDGDGDEPSGAEATAVREQLIALSGVAGAKTVTREVVLALAAKVGAGSRDIVTLSAVPAEGGKRDYLALNVPAGALVDGAVFRAMQADFELDRAIHEGKILPAKREAFAAIAHRDIEIFRAMIAAQPPVIRYDIAGTPIAGTEKPTELSDQEKQIATMLGNDPAQVLAAKRALAGQLEAQ